MGKWACGLKWKCHSKAALIQSTFLWQSAVVELRVWFTIAANTFKITAAHSSLILKAKENSSYRQMKHDRFTYENVILLIFYV